MSLTGNPSDVAGKAIRNLGSFRASSQDAQRDPLYHADSNRTLTLPGTPPEKPKASPTKPMVSVSLGKGTGDAKTPSRGRSSDGHRSRRHHSRRHHHGHSSSKREASCRKKLLTSPVSCLLDQSCPAFDIHACMSIVIMSIIFHPRLLRGTRAVMTAARRRNPWPVRPFAPKAPRTGGDSLPNLRLTCHSDEPRSVYAYMLKPYGPKAATIFHSEEEWIPKVLKRSPRSLWHR